MGNSTRTDTAIRKLLDEADCPSATCCASLSDIQAAKKQRLNDGLRTIAEWCISRADGDHDTDTTLTMLERKATSLRGLVLKAGWKEVEFRSGGWSLIDGKWVKNGSLHNH